VRDFAGEEEFMLETLDDLRVACKVRLQNLQRDKAIEFAVIGLIDSAHAAFPEQSLDDEAWS